MGAQRPNTRPAYPPEVRREAVQMLRAGRTPHELAQGSGCPRRRSGTGAARTRLVPASAPVCRPAQSSRNCTPPYWRAARLRQFLAQSDTRACTGYERLSPANWPYGALAPTEAAGISVAPMRDEKLLERGPDARDRAGCPG